MFYSFAGPVLEKQTFFDFRVFISGKQEKNIRVGEFLTGSVGLPETFPFFFFRPYVHLILLSVLLLTARCMTF